MTLLKKIIHGNFTEEFSGTFGILVQQRILILIKKLLVGGFWRLMFRRVKFSVSELIFIRLFLEVFSHLKIKISPFHR